MGAQGDFHKQETFNTLKELKEKAGEARIQKAAEAAEKELKDRLDAHKAEVEKRKGRGCQTEKTPLQLRWFQQFQ